jgi:hypothetical protein
MYTAVVEAMERTGFWGAVRIFCLPYIPPFTDRMNPARTRGIPTTPLTALTSWRRLLIRASY